MKFQDINIGDVAELTHQLSADDVRRFVELTGDDNRLHTDARFAANTAFKTPVVHGMLGASFISTVIGTKLPGDGALWFSQNLEFLLPVRQGDTLTIRVEVLQKDERSQVVELQTDIINQHHQTVTKGIARVKITRQETSRSEPKESSNVTARVALVVGGSGGIGGAASVALAEAGFDIAVHYFKNNNTARNVVAAITEKGRNANAFHCDVRDQASVGEMVAEINQRLGPISVMVNCSTERIAPIKFTDLRWDDIQLHINNQIQGTFNLVRSIVPHMKNMGYGKIISIDTQYVDAPEANLIAYITAKSALRGFSRSLALDLAPSGIRVNTVSPGMTDTDQLADVPERVRLVTAAKTPLRRLASTEDIAKAIVFLASNQSDFLCGETIRINGGQVML